MGSSGSRCICRAWRASTTSYGRRARRRASPTATSSIRTKWSSRPTTFEHACIDMLLRHFVDHEQACIGFAGRRSCAARLRAGAQSLAYLQSARCAPCHVGHRTAKLSSARAHPRARRGAGLLRESRVARLSTLQRHASCGRRMRAERRDFLVEIGTEELPPKALPELSRAFVSALTAALAAGRPQPWRAHAVCNAAPTRGPRAAPCRAPARAAYEAPWPAAQRRVRCRRRTHPRGDRVCAKLRHKR